MLPVVLLNQKRSLLSRIGRWAAELVLVRTWAGATDDAVKAAITKMVERNGTIMKTVTCAVIRPVGELPQGIARRGWIPDCVASQKRPTCR